MRYYYDRPRPLTKTRQGYAVYTDCQKETWITVKECETIIGEIHPGRQEQKTDELLYWKRVLPFGAVRRKKPFFQKYLGCLPCKDEQGNHYGVAVYVYSWKRIVLVVVLGILMAMLAFWGIREYYLWATPTITHDEVIATRLPDAMHNEDPGSFLLPDYTRMEWDLTEDQTKTWLINPEGNPYNVKYLIHLDDGRTLYESEVLRPGEVIQGFSPYHLLSVGVYGYTIECQMLEPEEEEPVNVQKMKGELQVYG